MRVYNLVLNRKISPEIICDQFIDWYNEQNFDKDMTMGELYEHVRTINDFSIEGESQEIWLRNIDRLIKFNPFSIVFGGDMIRTGQFRVVRGSIIMEGNLEDCMSYIDNNKFVEYVKMKKIDAKHWMYTKGTKDDYTYIQLPTGQKIHTTVELASYKQQIIIQELVRDDVENVEHWVNIAAIPNV